MSLGETVPFGLNTGSLLTGVVLLAIFSLPMFMIIYAGQNEVKDRPKTFEEIYPDEHLFI